MIKKGLVQKLVFRGRIVGCLAASTRFLGKMAKPHTMGLAGPLPLHANGVDEPQWVVQYVCGHRQDEKRAGSHGWSHCSNVRECTGGQWCAQHYFGGAVIPRLRDGLHHCNVLDRLETISTVGAGGGSSRTVPLNGCSRATSPTANYCNS